MIHYFVQVAIDVPLFKLFEYSWNCETLGKKPEIGQLIEVEFGSKRVAAIVLMVAQEKNKILDNKKYAIKEVISIAPSTTIPLSEIKLYQFVAKYYLRPLGEVVFSSIPSEWKKPECWPKIKKSIEKKDKKTIEELKDNVDLHFKLNEEQSKNLELLNKISGFQVLLLKGITGSGKTAVYLKWLNQITENQEKQCLILVPEINLTPQLEKTVRESTKDKRIVVLHSNLTPSERNYAWWQILMGKVQIIIGTRLSILSPIKNLSAIVIDEEHDNSYKQQEGMRYSARDVAIAKANELKIPILLCSATPSLETWLKVKEEKIKLLELKKRANTEFTIPDVEIVDLKIEGKSRQFKDTGLTQSVIQQIENTVLRKKQTLIFINRRGVAPVIHCKNCEWKSECKKCSAWMVLHKKIGGINKPVLHCHHCGLIESLPNQCPKCHQIGLETIGRGTQKIEEIVESLFKSQKILRVDTDSTKSKGKTVEIFDKIHKNEADIIIGTQMLSKGHDFKNVETVVVVDIDKSLYSQDFRAIEKMFAQLVQVTGRGGRGKDLDNSKIMIQTEFKDHTIFKVLEKTDFSEFYDELLEERKSANLPPYSYQALIICESKLQEKNEKILMELINNLKVETSNFTQTMIYDPVTRGVARVAGIERTQILIESNNRKELQQLLEIALDYCEEIKLKQRSVKLIIERDPITF